jgi:hypothetical protein
MSDILTLKSIVNDYLQSTAPAIVDATLNLGGTSTTKATTIDSLILQAANNARKRIEEEHDFDWQNDTVKGVIPLDGKGIHLYDFYTIPNLAGTFVAASDAGPLTMDLGGGNLNVNGPIPVKDSFTHVVLKDEADTAGFTMQALAVTEGPDLRAAWPNFNLTGGSSIPNATYEVSVKFAANANEVYIEDFRKIKTINDAWLVDSVDGKETPVRWERKKRTSRRLMEHMERRLPDGVAWDFSTLMLNGQRMFIYPESTGADVIVHLDANLWARDYTEDNDSDPFLEHGFEYMQWACIVEVNRLLRQFVPRQEGNLPPPIRERDEAKENLINFDIYQTVENVMHDMD